MIKASGLAVVMIITQIVQNLLCAPSFFSMASVALQWCSHVSPSEILNFLCAIVSGEKLIHVLKNQGKLPIRNPMTSARD